MTAGRSFPRRSFGTFLVERGFAQKPQFPRIGQSFVLPFGGEGRRRQCSFAPGGVA